MASSKQTPLTDREAEILDILWQAGAATADEVRSQLSGQPHDSTVRTLLRVMEQKRLITHTVQNRSYVYRPRIARNKAQRTAIRGLVAKLFSGSTTNLVLRLLDDAAITPEELEQIARRARQADDKPQRGQS